MKGFVETPDRLVDVMVAKLFHRYPPTTRTKILDPGCGRGAFIDGILRWCARRDLPIPPIVGIESNPGHAAVARSRFVNTHQVEIRCADFLRRDTDSYDYIIGNPPYVPITALTEE